MGLVQSEDLSSSCGSDEAEREDDTTSTNVSSRIALCHPLNDELKNGGGGGETGLGEEGDSTEEGREGGDIIEGNRLGSGGGGEGG